VKTDPLLVYTLDRQVSHGFALAILVALALVGPVLVWRAMEQGTMAVVPALGVCGIGLVPLVTWCLWMQRNIRRITWLPAEGRVELELLGPLGGRTVQLAPADFVDAGWIEGKLDLPGRPLVDAPYHRIRVRGGLPRLVLDGQGTVHDTDALGAILAGRAPGA